MVGVGVGKTPQIYTKYSLGSLSEDFHVTFMTPLLNFERRTIPERNENILLLNLHPFLYVYF